MLSTPFSRLLLINPLLLFHPSYQCQWESFYCSSSHHQWIDSIEFHNDQEIASVSSTPTELKE